MGTGSLIMVLLILACNKIYFLNLKMKDHNFFGSLQNDIVNNMNDSIACQDVSFDNVDGGSWSHNFHSSASGFD